MHGSPFIRTVVVMVALLAAAAPLWRMTHEAVAEVVIPAVAAKEAKSEVHLAVAFAQKPLRFEVDYLGKPVWEAEVVNGLTAEKDIAMEYPKEGVDLEYKVTWPPGTGLTAARLAVGANDAEAVERTLWGTGGVDDVVSFP